MSPTYPYQLYEMAHAALAPARAMSDATHFAFNNPWNPLSNTPLGKNISAGTELFERLTRRYGKPAFGLNDIHVDGVLYPILEEVVWSKPFCSLLHFARPDFAGGASQPKLLIVAPMSGHYATLLRGTVEAFLPHCDVYVTDWADARMVPLALGPFDLDDYIVYLREILVHLGPGVHTIGVCQPSVPLLAAAALMEADGDPQRTRQHDLDGRPGRHPPQSDRGQQARREAWRRMVPPQLPPYRAVPLSRLRPGGLSGLPSAQRLHGDEHRPPRLRSSRHVQASRHGR